MLSTVMCATSKNFNVGSDFDVLLIAVAQIQINGQ
jgi:hypothetical protein